MKNPDINTYLKQLLKTPFKSKKKSVKNRIKSNVPGFDILVGGGFLPNSIVTVAGGMASGKTIFALESFLERDYSSKRKGIIISFSEAKDELERLAKLTGISIPKEVEIRKFDPALFKSGEFLMELSELIKKGRFTDVLINSVSDIQAEELFSAGLRAVLKHYFVNALLCYSVPKDYCAPQTPTPFDQIFEISDAVVFLGYIQEAKDKLRFMMLPKFRGGKANNGIIKFSIRDKGIVVISGENVTVEGNKRIINAEVSFNDMKIDGRVTDGFKKINTNVELRILGHFPDSKEQRLKQADELRTGILNGSFTSDVFKCQLEEVQGLAEQGLLSPLNNYFHAEKNEFYGGVYRSVSINQDIWAVPHLLFPFGIVYRKDILKKYGIRYPSTPEEMLDVAGFTMKKEKLESGFSVPTSPGSLPSLQYLLLSLSLKIKDLGGYDPVSEFGIMSKGTKESVSLLSDCINKNRLTKAGQTSAEVRDSVLKKKTVFAFMNMFGSIASEMKQDGSLCDKIGFEVLPHTEGCLSVTYCTGAAFAVPKTAKIPAYSGEVIEYLTSKDVAVMAVESGNYPLPSARINVNEELEKRMPCFKDLSRIMENSIVLPEVSPRTEMMKALEDLLLNTIRKGADIEDELNKANEKYKIQKKANYYSQSIQKTIRYMRDNCSEKITSGSLAGSIGISPSHYERLFKTKMGMNVYKYLTKVRMERAKELLSNKYRNNVGEVAGKVGYMNSHNFAKTFKKYMGKTPSEYR